MHGEWLRIFNGIQEIVKGCVDFPYRTRLKHANAAVAWRRSTSFRPRGASGPSCQSAGNAMWNLGMKETSRYGR
jgi:hypothetical protein